MNNHFEIKNGMLIKYHGNGRAVVIPEGVTVIGSYAFSGCSNLKSVMIPEGVSVIGWSAFSGCSSLTSVAIPESVTSIGDGAFAECTNLNSVTIRKIIVNPDGVDLSDIAQLILEKDYSVKMKFEVKYHLIFQMFMLDMDIEGGCAYIKKQCKKMMKYLIDGEKTEILQKVLDSGKFITKKNIDRLIQYAIDNKKYQSQVMLTNYKMTQNWYEDTEKAIKKKFKL